MADRDKPKLLVICGATATGKTKLGVELAKRLNGEIISADSMQLYRGLDIGTAKPTSIEMSEIEHHLLDFINPNQKFSAADYVKAANDVIGKITNKNKLPIMVGGTGQYISATVNGISFTEEKSDENLRNSLAIEAQSIGNEAMHQKLKLIDPLYADMVHPNNAHRVQRALELYTITGKTMSQQLQSSIPAQKPYNAKVFCIGFKNREILYNRINLRVDTMVANGLLDEAKLVYQNRCEYKTAAQAIGYKEFFYFFENKATLQECIEKLKQASRNYAKRQLTWFNKIDDAHYLFLDEQDCEKEIIKIWESSNNE